MRTIRIKKGLNIPLQGPPQQEIADGRPVASVAVLGPDYVGMKPTMAVAEGDRVKLGQVLFSDKKTEGVHYTAPAAGEVTAVNRGAKRALQSVVIRLEGDEQETFDRYDDPQVARLEPQTVQENLIRSGLWTALRTRPMSKVPAPGTAPNAIFVTAIDTHPLAADPAVIIAERPEEFTAGLKVLGCLGAEKIYVCQAPGSDIPGRDIETDRVELEHVAFSGPHPAGLPGTHIHLLDPVGRHRTAWQINYQDVMAIGHLFRTGRLDTRRVVSLAGPLVREPRLVRTRLGASITDLVDGELDEADEQARVISGSVLSGRRAHGPLAYLGRYHGQVTALEEGYHQQFFGWYDLGLKKASVLNVVFSRLTPRRPLPLTTAINGGGRPIYPAGTYEKVMPLDILPTFLLRALAVDDVEQAEALGCLELDEEDLALCTFVCPGKQNFGPMLRRNLTTLEKEG